MVEFAKTVWALYLSTFVMGGLLLYELYAGEVITRSAPRITRRTNPLRYWLWILFHGAVLALLIYFWVSGVGTK